MKLIKYIFTLLVGATALSLTSCNDFLDRDPLGQFTEDDSPNALVGGKIFNVYYLMRSYDITAGIPAFMVHMVRSEDSEKGSDAGDGSNEAAMWDDFEYTASNGPLSAYWGQNYKIIYQCNEILDDIEKSGHKDDTEAIRNRGEALFFRAWCYFNLVRAFGEVPLVTIKVVEASDANVPKTTAEKIYEQIDKDLTEAEECLPLRWDSDYTGRLTWGAARSPARTHLYDAERLGQYVHSLHRSDKVGHLQPEYTGRQSLHRRRGKLRREHLRTAMRSHRCHERGCQHRQPVLPGARGARSRRVGPGMGLAHGHQTDGRSL